MSVTTNAAGASGVAGISDVEDESVVARLRPGGWGCLLISTSLDLPFAFYYLPEVLSTIYE